MRRILTAAACMLAVAAGAFAATKPTTIRLKGEDVTAEFVWEKGGRLSVTSKPVPIRPGEYTVKALSLFKKDAKGKTWELRAIPASLNTLAMVAVEAEQDKVLLIGSRIAVHVAGAPAPGKPVTLYIRFLGGMSEMYIPGAFLDGKHPPAPTLTIKDKEGKVVGGGPITANDGGLSSFVWKVPADLKGSVTVEIAAQMGPFELVQPTGTLAVK